MLSPVEEVLHRDLLEVVRFAGFSVRAHTTVDAFQEWWRAVQVFVVQKLREGHTAGWWCGGSIVGVDGEDPSAGGWEGRRAMRSSRDRRMTMRARPATRRRWSRLRHVGWVHRVCRRRRRRRKIIYMINN